MSPGWDDTPAPAALSDYASENDSAERADGQEAAGEAQPAPQFGSVDEWVRGWLAQVYLRRIDGRTRWWASDWWNYPEAVQRLTGLWHAWEYLRLDARTGLSVFWRDHLDHHMPILTGPDGPFAEIPHDKTAVSASGQPLPCDPPPAQFPDQRAPAAPSSCDVRGGCSGLS